MLAQHHSSATTPAKSRQKNAVPNTRLGRPKLGTEQERHQQLLAQALTLLMTEGVARTSMARIAVHCGVSTRTLYDRFENKDALLVAALKQMVEQDVLTMVQLDQLSQKPLPQVLAEVSRFILNRVLEPSALSFYRICIAEVSHLPDLSRAIKTVGPERIHQMLAEIFAFYATRGAFPSLNFMQLAESYCELLIAAPRQKALFGWLPPDWDSAAHIQYVMTLFFKGIDGMEPAHASP